jgi:hypothetical protein
VIETDRLAELPFGFIQAAKPEQSESMVVAVDGGIGLDPQRFPELLFGQDESALCQVHLSEIGVSPGRL